MTRCLYPLPSTESEETWSIGRGTGVSVRGLLWKGGGGEPTVSRWLGLGGGTVFYLLGKRKVEPPKEPSGSSVVASVREGRE